jgi:transposase InsO family protein
MLSAEGIKAGRFKVRQIMREANLMSKQPGSYRYRHAKVARLDIPNLLKREFSVSTPNRITQSMSRRGNCWDNAPMERLFRSLKLSGYQQQVT